MELNAVDNNEMSSGNTELSQCLRDAREAYEAQDSNRLTECCKRALELQENNAEAWELLACFGGWDAKMHVLDVDFAIESATHALGLASEGKRHEVATEIYGARKKQIALCLEDDMMMPSYMGAKQLHKTMGDWQRMLVEIPYLSRDLLEDELNLVDNLCLRSKLGIMPGDRLVYTAYATLNDKVPYGDTFRKALAPRLTQVSEQEAARRAESLERIEAWRERYREWVVQDAPTAEERKARLQEELNVLQAEVDELVGQSGRGLLLQQIEELEQRKTRIGKFKVFQRREVDAQIAAAKAKLEQIEAALVPARAPLEEAVTQIKQLLDEVSA
ncbi:MAG: hypothetical protein Q4D27_03540 [Coriobacteriia bacterium]|nr:hypothetical protein [Coriobacteriia bacterium]